MGQVFETELCESHTFAESLPNRRRLREGGADDTDWLSCLHKAHKAAVLAGKDALADKILELLRVPEEDDLQESLQRVPTDPDRQIAWLRAGYDSPAFTPAGQVAVRPVLEGNVPVDPDKQLAFLRS